MIRKRQNINKTSIGLNSQRGFTLVELLISLFLSSIIMLGAVEALSVLSKLSGDSKLRVVAQLEAQGALEMMIGEFRMIGNGVPFHQSNFLIGQVDLADNTVTQPILVDGTTDSQIRFRINQSGETYLLTSSFDPAASTTIELTSVAKIIVGDQIYITNATVGADDGLWATVTEIDNNANQITIAAGAQYSTNSTFSAGSLLEVVPVVTYTSTPDYGGIIRDDGLGDVIVVPTGEFSLEFLNTEGDPITLPLEATPADPFPASAIQNVHAISISIQVRSTTRMSSGEYYVAVAEQTVGIRNLNFKY